MANLEPCTSGGNESVAACHLPRDFLLPWHCHYTAALSLTEIRLEGSQDLFAAIF